MKITKQSVLSACGVLLAALLASAAPALSQNNARRWHSRSLSDPIGSSGEFRILVILADFSDEPGRYTQEEFRELFFEQGDSSFADFYRENSYGELDYSGDVAGITAGVPVLNSDTVSYVRLPSPKSYYSDGTAGSPSSPFPANFAGIFYDAVRELESSGFDFSPYANDEGELEHVILMFAGRSSVESGDADDLQPTAYSLEAFFGGGYQSNGFIFKNFTFCPERDGSGRAPIGVCAHEHGHNLGIPDLYDLSYETRGAGYFDLMAFGTYNNGRGTRPFHFSAFPKVTLGWVQPYENRGAQETVVLAPVEQSAAVLKLVPEGANNEYFLLENRQALGFDDGFSERDLCTGLYIWHIDENVYFNYLEDNLVNTSPSLGGPEHYAVLLLEQDGRSDISTPGTSYGECEDAFRVGDMWDDETPSNSKLWDGTSSGFSVHVLSKSGNGSLTLLINGEAVPAVRIQTRGRKISGTLLNSPSPAGLVADLIKQRSGAVVKQAVTSAEGEFTFGKAKPGLYRVEIDGLSSEVFRVRRRKRLRRGP